MPRATGGHKTPREVGAYGNNRGKPALARTRRRAGDKRVQTGLAKARSDQAALDARIARETADSAAQDQLLSMAASSKALPTAVVVNQAPAARRARQVSKPPAPDPWKKGTGAWDLGDSRQLIRDGYDMAHVVKFTGWGTAWFSDMPEAYR